MILAQSRADILSYSLKIALSVALLILCAKITVPFWPVPMTLQTSAILLIAGIGGMRFGLHSVTSYLALGATGLPVFAGANGAGLAYMFGPTGGYLLGFLLAALITGFVADRFGKRALLIAMPIAALAIYAPGLAWLAQFVPADSLFAAGMAPFLLGDAAKTAVALMLTLAAPSALKRWLKP